MIKNNHLPFILLIIAILLQASLTLCYSITLHYELKSSGEDGAAFMQLLYNIINGRGMLITLAPPNIEQTWLGIHFSPILYVVALIYWLFPHIETLLFLQNLGISIAAIPIFIMANIFLKSPWQALLISIFYLINPFVVNAQIWDFHEIAIPAIVILMILCAIVLKHRIWLLFFCLVLLTTKEHYGIAVFGTGLLWAWYWKDYKFGIALAATGLISFLLVLQILMPYLSGIPAPAMLGGIPELDRYSWIKHPFQDIDLLKHMAIKGSEYIFLLLIPMLIIIPLSSFMWLLPAMASLATNILARTDYMVSPFSYHSASLVAILLVAYSKTLSEHRFFLNIKRRWEILAATSICSFIFSYNLVALPLFPSNVWEFSSPRLTLLEDDKKSVDKISQLINNEDSISVQTNIAAVLPVRRKMFLFPDRTNGVDYIIINTSFPYKKRTHVFGTPYWYEGDAGEYFSKAKYLLASSEWGVIFYQNNWLVFKHNAKDDDALREAAQQDFTKLKQYYDNIYQIEKSTSSQMR